MRYTCPQCKRTTEDGNLWCQDVNCLVGTFSEFLRYGDMLGPLTILDLKRVFRASTLYEARLGDVTYYVKIAHPGKEDYLHDEAYLLYTLTSQISAGKTVWDGLPIWCQHPEANKEQWGVTTHNGQPVHYLLLRHQSGEFLYDHLLRNPEPWHKQVGWIMVDIADAVSNLQSQAYLSLHLNPDTILIYNDRDVLRPLLLDLGVLHYRLADDQKHENNLINYPQTVRPVVNPAYVAPEVLQGNAYTQSDVYTLGAIFYELLASKPLIPHIQRSLNDIERSVVSYAGQPHLVRGDLPPKVRQILAKATDPNPNERYADALDFLKSLQSVEAYRNPTYKQSWYAPSRWQTPGSMRVAIVVLVIALLSLATVLSMVILASIDTA